MKTTVKEFQEFLKNCDPDTEIEFRFHNSLDDVPRHTAFILQYRRWAYYKTNRNPPLLIINFTEHPFKKVPTANKEKEIQRPESP